MKEFKLMIFLLLIFTLGKAQNTTFTRNSFYSAGYNQINEGANFGLIFKGPGLN